MAEDADVELVGVSKRFGDALAVDRVDLTVDRGELVTLLGPSGCGKTTVLRMIAGLETPTTGDIRIRGRSVLRVPPYKRPVSLVFQNLALFPHLSVEENVGFGPAMDRLGRAEGRRRVAEYLDLVRLSGLENRRVGQLSGGQRQRVALARALVRQPAVLLLDEPLSSLDLTLRRQLQVELKAIQRQLGTTFVFVTHDQDEALVLSDRIAVMSGGRVEQYGPAREVYESPRTSFVAGFVGDTNLLTGAVTETTDDMIMVACGQLSLRVRPGDARAATDHDDRPEVQVSLRPDRIDVEETAWRERPPTPNEAQGTVASSTYRGTTIRLLVEASGLALTCETPARPGVATPAVGANVVLRWDDDAATVIPPPRNRERSAHGP